MSSTTTTHDSYDTWRRIRAIIGASSGNLVEWFDFYIYSFASLYFAHAFFPQGDGTVQLLKTAAVFAIGFLMRPIGGIIFGRLADRRGRRAAMMLSVVMMCGGSLMIACLPTYEQVGVWAPTLLVIARMLQGLSVGGEYGTSATYMSEVAVKGHRGFYSSFQYVTLIGGLLLASLAVVIMQHILTDSDMRSWGWRILFLCGAVAALLSLFLRRSLHETVSKDRSTEQSEKAGTLSLLFSKHQRAFWTVLGFTAGGSLMFYTFTTYMQKYLINTVGMNDKTVSVVVTVALVVFMLMQPVQGALSDCIGLRRMMLIFSALGTLLTIPILFALQYVGHVWAVFLLLALSLIIVGFYTSISGLIKAAMFPMEIRALGVGVSYAIGNALFGGTAEWVALTMKTHGVEPLFFVYVTLMVFIAFVTCLKMAPMSEKRW